MPIKLLECEIRPNNSIRVWTNYPSGRRDLPLFTLTEEQEQESDFLCKHNDKVFTSNISNTKGFGKHVQCYRSKIAIPITDLTQLYLIEDCIDAD